MALVDWVFHIPLEVPDNTIQSGDRIIGIGIKKYKAKLSFAEKRTLFLGKSNNQMKTY